MNTSAELALSDDSSILLNTDDSAILISVIIPTYNRIKLLPDLIRAWRKVHQRTKISYEIIFSDDGSDDGSADFLESIRGLPIKVLLNIHGGASSARNAAIRVANGNRLLIIGDDIFPDPEILNIHAEVGFDLGDMVATLGAVDWHEDLPVNHLMHHITEVGNEQFSYNRLLNNSYVDFRHFYTSNICVPRHFLCAESVIFDERFDEYGYEDIELGYRLANRGLKIYLTKAAVGGHYHPYSPADFCRRQISAGRMAVLFAELHPEVGSLLGISDLVEITEDQDDVWRHRWDLLVSRCNDYEALIEALPSTLSGGIRRSLSLLYSNLFEAMYCYGILQKYGQCKNPLAAAMTTYFSSLDADSWCAIQSRGDQKLQLSKEEIHNLGEVLLTGRRKKLIGTSQLRIIFNEINSVRNMIKKNSRKYKLQKLRRRIGRGLYYLFKNPNYLAARIKQHFAAHLIFKSAALAPVSQIPLVAIPGLLLDPGGLNREELITSARAVFGASLKVYELAANTMLTQLDEAGLPLTAMRPEDVEATIFFWPTTAHFLNSRDRFVSAYLTIVENGVDIALISHSLSSENGEVVIGEFRNHTVFSRRVLPSILTGKMDNIPLSGKVLRLLPSWGGESKCKLNNFFGQEVIYSGNGFFSCSKNSTLKLSQYVPIYPLPYKKNRPLVFVFPIVLAVGGVERNTIEIMRELNEVFDFVVITMEPLRPEQGSLVEQAQEVSLSVIEMPEIVDYRHYLRVLSRLQSHMKPNLVWVCNGSTWFSDNAEAIRHIFSDIPIIDQEAYDAQQGWITRYDELGIQSFDHFIAINKKIEARLLLDFEFSASRVHLIYPAIDSTRILSFRECAHLDYEFHEKFNLPVGKKIFTFIGRLTSQKQPLKFLQLALRRLAYSDEFFVLVGDGELASELDKFILAHGLTNVKRITYIENILELNAISFGIIFTSLYEGLPVAMLEAMAMGVPVFSTDVGDIADILKRYDCGEVIPALMSADEVVNAFEFWLAQRDRYAASLNSKYNEILEYFSTTRIARDYIKCWQDAMNQFEQDRK